MLKINKNNILSLIYGFAIGDALGVPFEFQSSEYCKKYYKGKYITGTHSQQPGTWSDDTSILLCVLDSKGDIEKYKQNLKDWYNNSSKFNCDGIFDIGAGIREAIESNFTNDTSQSKGNACLCVALGCWLIGLSFEYCERFVRLTHSNNDAILSSKNYYNALKGLNVGAKLNAGTMKTIISNKGFCKASLDIAISSLWAGTCYISCVNKAICHGHDTDSHAAFTGALTALKYKIPKGLIEGLRGKEKIDNIWREI